MGLNRLDLAVVALYLAGITAFGLRFRRRQRSLRDYFLAGRDIPWWAISLSIVAAETSTLTIISIPGLAYATNFGFLQLVMGYIVGRVVISFVLIPHYFRGDLFTAYELMERRFGPRLRSLTAGLFLITRAAAEGVRVFAVAIVVRISLAWIFSGMSDFSRDVAAIAIVTVLTLVYTFEGGMTAVIWTDVVQSAIYIGGTAVGVFTLLRLVPGGWTQVHQIAAAAGKFRVFNFNFNFWQDYTFWAGVIGGAFLTTASHGTDQLIVQRLLAARSEAQSKAALLFSGVAVFGQFALFLLVGAMLYAYYQMPVAAWQKTDYIFPTFIVQHMPQVVRGIMIAAILAAAMSNLSAALNSLSSSAIMDFYMRRRPHADERERVLISRWATVGWGLVLFVLAVLSRGQGSVVEVGLRIASVAYGALLGVFLLGTLTRRATESGAMVGFACGFAWNCFMWISFLLRQHFPVPSPGAAMSARFMWGASHVPFTWYVMIGSLLTFGIGYAASYVMRTGESHA
ncbi:MAG: sodium:solute symporter [Acidobacteria bacterium]|nr:sodium:solute symporter [Acidobacteriota bacterium]